MNASRSGQILPAEWAPQSAVMLTWPHVHSDWRDILADVEPVYVAIAREIARRELLLVACHDEFHRNHVAHRLVNAGVDLSRTRLHLAESNDTWARDHGPLTVLRNGRPVILDFRFNGWGNKYRHDKDDAITARLHGVGVFGATPREPMDLILEGGGIESDGLGTLMTTAHCQLSPERNPEYSREQLNELFARVFGTPRVLWLEHGQLAGDDTDGHIDTLARFCDAETIAYVSCENPADEHYAPLRAMEAELRSFRTADGRPYTLVPLPLPNPHYGDDGRRLPATHANFLIINDAVLVPTYHDVVDALVLERLRGCFPGREVIGIDCSPLIRQYGSLHCITMQIPAGVVV
ncbi:MAG: agmatine deiminase family protein [Gammaproteobacteria bacterium]|nr:agmatine deiminase family protein [Gammaproteobacteria bacterium]